MTLKQHLRVVDRYGNRSHPRSATSIPLPQLDDLKCPATDSADSSGRDEFRLNTFPTGNHAPPPAK